VARKLVKTGRIWYELCSSGRPVQGRITERHLPLAEKSCPGIGRLYNELAEKPATFLQLLWIYEERQLASASRTRARARRRKG
jgi:hypothetical protein